MNKKEVRLVNEQLSYLSERAVTLLEEYNRGIASRTRVLNATVALNSLIRMLDLLGNPHGRTMVEVRLIYRNEEGVRNLTIFPRDWNGGEDE